MRVCFDTNVVIDILGASEWLAGSLAAYDVANMRRFDSFIPASAVTDIAYILHRRGMPQQKVREALPALFEMFDVMDVTGADCRNAAASPMDDFEDAVIAASAERNGIDLIVSRDETGFVGSPVARMAPCDFVRQFKGDDLDYAEVDL